MIFGITEMPLNVIYFIVWGLLKCPLEDGTSLEYWDFFGQMPSWCWCWCWVSQVESSALYIKPWLFFS